MGRLDLSIFSHFVLRFKTAKRSSKKKVLVAAIKPTTSVSCATMLDHLYSGAQPLVGYLTWLDHQTVPTDAAPTEGCFYPKQHCKGSFIHPLIFKEGTDNEPFRIN